MIVTQAAAPVYPQPRISSLPAPAPDEANDARVEPTAKGGARGLALLASDTAAIILTEQSIPPVDAPAAAPAPAGLDLRGRDLREVDLSKLDLRGADLSDANLSGKDLTGLDLQGATMTRANLDGANLTDTNLNAVSASGASFRQASFARTNMNDADFSGASFAKATFARGDMGMTQDELEKAGRGFVIKSSDLTGADFSDASFNEGGGFWTSKLDNVNFDRLKTGRNEFHIGSYHALGIRNSTVKGATFRGMAAQVSIDRSDASNADFSGISAGGVTIGGSKIDGVSFKDSSTKLFFSDVDLRNVDLSIANKDARDSIFQNVIMTGMNFSGYDFSGSLFINDDRNMRNSFHEGSDKSLAEAMTGTDFRGAKFRNVNFNNFDMDKALVDTGALAEVVVTINNSIDGGPPARTSSAISDNGGKPASSGRSGIRQALVDGGVLPGGTNGTSAAQGRSTSGIRTNVGGGNLALGQALINAGAFTGVAQNGGGTADTARRPVIGSTA
jgi:uncharacterized protein YjbI with pentapeptide repeats